MRTAQVANDVPYSSRRSSSAARKLNGLRVVNVQSTRCPGGPVPVTPVNTSAIKDALWRISDPDFQTSVSPPERMRRYLARDALRPPPPPPHDSAGGNHDHDGPSGGGANFAPSSVNVASPPSIRALSRDYDELARKLMNLGNEPPSGSPSRPLSVRRTSTHSTDSTSDGSTRSPFGNRKRRSSSECADFSGANSEHDDSLSLPRYENATLKQQASVTSAQPETEKNAVSLTSPMASPIGNIAWSEIKDSSRSTSRRVSPIHGVSGGRMPVAMGPVLSAGVTPSASTGNLAGRNASSNTRVAGKTGSSTPCLPFRLSDDPKKPQRPRPFPIVAPTEVETVLPRHSSVSSTSTPVHRESSRGKPLAMRNMQVPLSLQQRPASSDWASQQRPLEYGRSDSSWLAAGETAKLAPHLQRSNHAVSGNAEQRPSKRSATALLTPARSTSIPRDVYRTPDSGGSFSALAAVNAAGAKYPFHQDDSFSSVSPTPPTVLSPPRRPPSKMDSSDDESLYSGEATKAPVAADSDTAPMSGDDVGFSISNYPLWPSSSVSALIETREGRPEATLAPKTAGTGVATSAVSSEDLSPHRPSLDSVGVHAVMQRRMYRSGTAVAGLLPERPTSPIAPPADGAPHLSKRDSTAAPAAVVAETLEVSNSALGVGGPGRARGGRIKVVVRKRPMGPNDVGAECVNVTPPSGFHFAVTKLRVDLSVYSEVSDFAFDHVFDEKSNNEHVYCNSAKQLLDTALEGSSASCFAYGQTGSGKTYTMMGGGGDHGLYLLAAADLFKRLTSTQRVYVSLYEIYCNSLYDLLNRRAPMVLREDANRRINICGLTRHSVSNVKDLESVITVGTDQRSSGSTSANEHSSRSHAVLTISIQDVENPRFAGTLNFVDLAGSERAADTANNDRQTRLEGAEINKSLLALKECIRGLDERRKHVPFRGSKLTEVLRDSFTGTSHTVMIATVAPNLENYEHSLNTIRYAFRVKGLSVPTVGPSKARNAPRAYVAPGARPPTVASKVESTISPTETPTGDGARSPQRQRGPSRRDASPRRVPPAFSGQSPASTPSQQQQQRRSSVANREGPGASGSIMGSRLQLPFISPPTNTRRRSETPSAWGRGSAADEALPVTQFEMDQMEARLRTEIVEQLRAEMQKRVAQVVEEHVTTIAELQRANAELRAEMAKLRQCVGKAAPTTRSDSDAVRPCNTSSFTESTSDKSGGTFGDR